VRDPLGCCCRGMDTKSQVVGGVGFSVTFVIPSVGTSVRRFFRSGHG
jgi:hypothetical protein